jgi:predicted transcriptional regulator
MDVLTVLRNSDRPLADDELAELVGRDPRSVSQECRRLAFRGILIREQHSGGVTVNKVYTGEL